MKNLLSRLPEFLANLPLGKKWKTTTGLIVAALTALAVSLDYLTNETVANALLAGGFALAGVGNVHAVARETVKEKENG